MFLGYGKLPLIKAAAPAIGICIDFSKRQEVGALDSAAT